ncbi:cadherin-related family member 5-like isoform X2 [Anguilla rostrata]|uniref:cadherin-related family member 5-like isoform X2 n=1 Tax=Anguilla rostrata TaxID=7938 RepID=UPI0030D32E69
MFSAATGTSRNGRPAAVCSAPPVANVEENQPAGTPVLSITAEAGVTFELQVNPGNFFRLEEAAVVVNTPLDYETPPTDIGITIQCTHPDQRTLALQVIVIVKNVNDVAPVFAQSQYALSTPELAPVGATVDTVEATDVEGDLLYYYMDPENEYFTIKAVNTPVIVVKKTADYDVVQSVSFKLIAVDTRTPPPPGVASFSATATVSISITDVDNRPPWFQPCAETTIGSSKICLGSGYRGRVNLTEKTEGVLPLEPGPVFAIDGDRGRNEQIIYRIMGGNEAGIFNLDENTGGITMLKAADVAGPVVLTVLALQFLNSDQFSTTTVTFDVVIRSQNPPQFDRQQYEGFISSDSGPSSLVLEDKSLDRPLRVQATDADFIDGVNPDVRYTVEDGSDFTVTDEGFVLLKTELSPGTVSIRVQAVDTSNGESGMTTVSIQVLPGATTAMSTTAMPTTDMPTTDMPTTGVANVTTGVTASAPTPNSSVPMTTETQESTAGPSTAHTAAETGLPPVLPGQYREADMVALGASLAVLVALCLAIIGLLLVRIRKGDAAWRKLSEASLFRSTLARGSGKMKEGVQYTNSGFQTDGDTGSVTSDLPTKADLALDGAGRGVGGGARETSPAARAAAAASALQEDFLPDGASLAGSDRADSEKGVKPILTKERRNEEGYKSVWFKEDIDPNAKEEVRIIPDSGERDADDEEEEEEEDEEGSADGEEDVSPPDTPSALQTALDMSGGAESRGEGEDSDL